MRHPLGHLLQSPAGEEEDHEWDIPTELGSLGMAHCPGNASIIAKPFHLQVRKWWARESNPLAQGYTGRKYRSLN